MDEQQESSVSEKEIADWLKLFYIKNTREGSVFVNLNAKVIFPPLTTWEKNFIKADLAEVFRTSKTTENPMSLIEKCKALPALSLLRIEDVLDFVKMAKDIAQLKNTKDHETSMDASPGADQHQLESANSSAELQRVYKDLFGEA